jgi:hypothetical protein
LSTLSRGYAIDEGIEIPIDSPSTRSDHISKLNPRGEIFGRHEFLDIEILHREQSSLLQGLMYVMVQSTYPLQGEVVRSNRSPPGRPSSSKERILKGVLQTLRLWG